MEDKEVIINERGAHKLTESKFKPFIPRKRKQKDKEDLAKMFENNFVKRCE